MCDYDHAMQFGWTRGALERELGEAGVKLRDGAGAVPMTWLAMLLRSGRSFAEGELYSEPVCPGRDKLQTC